MKAPILIICLIAYQASTGAVSPQGTWKYYTDGNSVNTIAACGEYVWCATASGLVRWDLRDKTCIHEVYSDPDACCWYQGNNMIALAVDGNGVAWCGNAFRKGQNWLFSFDGESWKAFTTENSGLPGSVAYLHFDHNGLLWVSTDNGIVRFDGKTWEMYSADSAGSPLIRVLGVDNENVVWFLTGKGVSSLDGAVWKAFTLDDGLPTTDIYTMAVGPGNVKWFTVNAQELVSFDGVSWKVHQGLAWIPYFIAVDRENMVWCGWKNGLARYDGAGWTYLTTENSGLPDNGIRAITVDNDGVLWISTGRGLTRFDSSTWETWRVDGPLSYSITCVTVDHNNVKWFGTWDGGISSFDGSVWKTYALPDTTTVPEGGQLWKDESIMTIIEDRDALLWLTYYRSYHKYADDKSTTWYEHGVMSFDGATFTDYPYEVTGFTSGFHSSIAVDHDNVRWFDTTSFDGSTWKTYKDDGAGHTLSRPVAVDRNNVKWFVSSGGAVSFDGAAWEYYDIGDLSNLRKIAVDANNVKWFQKQGSVIRFDGSMVESFKTPETKAYITDDMGVDGHGNVWFTATMFPASVGILCYNGSVWTYYLDDSWLLNAAGKMAVDMDNVKWVVTHSGIATFDGGPLGPQTKVNGAETIPPVLKISANYPNPFNASTTIEFFLPENGFASLIVYDITGRKVRELAGEVLSAGIHRRVWDGTDTRGNAASSGVYITLLKAGGNYTGKKLLLMK